jgi:hypothetical protein
MCLVTLGDALTVLFALVEVVDDANQTEPVISRMESSR